MATARPENTQSSQRKVQGLPPPYAKLSERDVKRDQMINTLLKMSEELATMSKISRHTPAATQGLADDIKLVLDQQTSVFKQSVDSLNSVLNEFSEIIDQQRLIVETEDTGISKLNGSVGELSTTVKVVETHMDGIRKQISDQMDLMAKHFNKINTINSDLSTALKDIKKIETPDKPAIRDTNQKQLATIHASVVEIKREMSELQKINHLREELTDFKTKMLSSKTQIPETLYKQTNDNYMVLRSDISSILTKIEQSLTIQRGQIDNNSYSAKIEELEKNLRQETDKRSTIEKLLNDESSKRKEIESELKKSKKAEDELENELEGVNSRLEQEIKKNKSLEEQLTYTKNTLKERVEEETEKKNALEKELIEIKEKFSTNGEVKKELETLENRLNKQIEEKRQLEDTLKEFLEEKKELENALKKESEEKEQLENKYLEEKKELENTLKKQSEEKNIIEKEKEEIEENFKKEKEALESSLQKDLKEKEEKLESLSKDKSTLEMKLSGHSDELSRRINELEKIIEDNQFNISDKDELIAFLEAEQKNMRTEKDIALEKVDDALSKYKEMEEEFRVLGQEYVKLQSTLSKKKEENNEEDNEVKRLMEEENVNSSEEEVPGTDEDDNKSIKTVTKDDEAPKKVPRKTKATATKKRTPANKNTKKK